MSKWGSRPEESITPKVPRGVAPRPKDTPEYDFYTIEGIKYKTERLLSATSGEAKIFLISSGGSQFVLKLYRPEIHPNHEVLDKVLNARGNGLVVDIYAHGVWTDPQSSAEFDYEIMQYCSGGSLASAVLQGDEKSLKDIAIRMASTLDFVHHLGLLHRDVKPANFLYTDQSKTAFVLTDFGLARPFDSEGRVATDEGRTKIYAAPEMYTYIPGTPTYVTAESDFYSMGMSLMALWMGEGRLIGDEVKIVKLKQEEALPYPNPKEMSEYTLSLLKALTRRNPDKRAGFEEVVRWAKGEIIYKDPLSEDPLHEFKIVFSASDNLIAHNPAELSQIMWSHKALAKRYLYSDTIFKWLSDIERPELAMEIKDITQMRYLADKESGLYAACLFLDPQMPFYGLNGEPLSSREQIAGEIFAHLDEYGSTLSDPNHLLWVYFRASGLEVQADAYPPLIKAYARVYTRRLVYELDQNLPWRFVKDGKWVDIDSLESLAGLFAGGQLDTSDLDWQTNDDFLTWAAGRNKALAGKAIKGISSAKKAGSLNNGHDWYVLYTLLPGYGYDFRPLKDSRLGSIEQIAEQIEAEALGRNSKIRLLLQIDDPHWHRTRLYNYLLAQGVYSKQIGWIEYCMNLKSSENSKKYGPYNARIAHLKTSSGLLGRVAPLLLTSKTLSTLEEFEKMILPDIENQNKAACNRIADWLTLFFQENPWADYSATPYYDLTRDYYDYISANLERCSYIDDNDKDIFLAGTYAKDCSRAWKSVTALKWLSGIFCFLPIVAACALMVYFTVSLGSGFMAQTIDKAGPTIGIIAGVVVGFIVLGSDWSWIWAIGAGILTSVVIKVLFHFVGFVAPWLVLALLVLCLVLFAKKIFFDNRYYFNDKYTDLPWDEAMERFYIGTAFGTKDKLLPGIAKDYPMCVLRDSEQVAKDSRKRILKSAAWMLGISIVVIGLCVWLGADVLKDLITNVQETVSQ